MDLNPVLIFIGGIGLLSLIDFIKKFFVKEIKPNVKKEIVESANTAVSQSTDERRDNLNTL